MSSLANWSHSCLPGIGNPGSPACAGDGPRLHKGRQGRQVPQSTWRWPGLQGPCDDSAGRQLNWPGAQAHRVPVWGKHLPTEGPTRSSAREDRHSGLHTTTLRERSRFCSFPLGTWGSVWHGLPLSNSFKTCYYPEESPVQPPSSLGSNNLSHIPWASPWCGFPTEGQKQRLNFGEIASPPGPKEKKKKLFKSSRRLQSFHSCFLVEQLVLLAFSLFTYGEDEAY